MLQEKVGKFYPSSKSQYAILVKIAYSPLGSVAGDLGHGIGNTVGVINKIYWGKTHRHQLL
jgi:hypothetical protein